MTKKEQFGEYSAYNTRAGIRFMKDGRLISKAKVPPEAAEVLTNRITGERSRVEEPRFPRPSEEEIQRMREESLKVNPELQMTPEEIKQRTPMTEDDFDEKHAEQVQEILDSDKPDASFIESISIHTASLEDMAQALYDRFGIYTVYLRELPRQDEVNPLTAQPFNKYHLGIAYQAAIYAQNQGLLDIEPELNRAQMDAGREASANLKIDPVNHTLAQARQANDFNFRTSVTGTKDAPTTRIEHIKGEDGTIRAVQVEVSQDELNPNLNNTSQRYDPDEDDIIVEPPIMGGKPVIRPNW